MPITNSRVPHLLLALALFFAPNPISTAAVFKRNWNEHALTLIPANSRVEGEWRAAVDLLKSDRRNSGMQIEIREDRSTYGFYLPTERAPQIEGKLRDGAAVNFEIETESGDLIFNGAVKNKFASGRYTFTPDADYATEAGKLLKDELTDDELLKLGFARISVAFIRGVIETLPAATLEDVVRLRNHGLDPKGMKEYAAAGFGKPEQMVRLRSHGVTPEYASKARQAGYGESVDDLTRLRSHGVTPEALDQWKTAGFEFSTDEMVRLRNFGVTPEYGAAWKKAGFDVSAEGLTRARSFGVPIEFVAALSEGARKPSLEEVIRMRQFGVSADFYREIKRHKPDYTVEEIVRLRQFGVTTDYLRAVCATRNDFTAEHIVKLRNHGVPADYVAALNVPDRKPLDVQAIIDLRSRGVSAETARKLRE